MAVHKLLNTGEVWKLYKKKGMSMADIARKYGVARSTILFHIRKMKDILDENK